MIWFAFMAILKHSLHSVVKYSLHASGYHQRMETLLSERVIEAVSAAEQKHSVTEIAKQCGVSRQTVYSWRRGEQSNLKGETLVELAEVSGYNPRWIISGKGRKSASVSSDERTILEAFRLLPPDIQQEQIETAKQRIERHRAQRMNAA